MCRLPDKAGAGSKSVAANGFPDSNQRRGVGQELVVGGGGGHWGRGRGRIKGMGKVAEVTLLKNCELFIHLQQAASC